MAFSLDFDIYNWLLVEILKVNPTGDPVNDAVYLVLLPMVVLYLFVHNVTKASRFAGTSVDTIIMFVMGFFIVREGFYPLFAGFSLPLLIIIMIWYSIDFIRGDKSMSGGRSAPGGGSSSSGWLGMLTKKLPFSALDIPGQEEAIKELVLLGGEWYDIEAIRKLRNLERLPEDLQKRKAEIRREAERKLDEFDDITKEKILNDRRLKTVSRFRDELMNIVKNEERYEET